MTIAEGVSPQWVCEDDICSSDRPSEHSWVSYAAYRSACAILWMFYARPSSVGRIDEPICAVVWAFPFLLIPTTREKSSDLHFPLPIFVSRQQEFIGVHSLNGGQEIWRWWVMRTSQLESG